MVIAYIFNYRSIWSQSKPVQGFDEDGKIIENIWKDSDSDYLHYLKFEAF